MQRWVIEGTQGPVNVLYKGKSLDGALKLQVGASQLVLSSSLIQGYGEVAPFGAGMRACFIVLAPNGVADVVVEGVSLRTGTASGVAEAYAASAPMVARQAAARKVIARMRGIFLAVIGLTVCNCLIIAGQTPLSFPFSAYLPVVFFAAGMESLEAPGGLLLMGVLGGLAALMILGLAALYLLSGRFKAASWIALVAFAADTLALVGLEMYAGAPGMGALLIGLGVHAWILVCLARLALAQHRLGAARAGVPAMPMPSPFDG